MSILLQKDLYCKAKLIFYRSVLPVWEELLIFNENYNYFIQEKPKVIILFEVSICVILFCFYVIYYCI